MRYTTWAEPNPDMPGDENDVPVYTEADMARAWRDGWVVGNRWAFSDADADAIETCPYSIIPSDKPEDGQ